jgi:hypothetical protein
MATSYACPIVPELPMAEILSTHLMDAGTQSEVSEQLLVSSSHPPARQVAETAALWTVGAIYTPSG